MVDFEVLVGKCRSYRRFDQGEAIGDELFRHLVGLARQTPSIANRQPLKYMLSSSPEMNGRIFDTLGWAGYLPDWPGPEPGERPAAYIVLLGDKTISKDWSVDSGIVMQTMLLGAVEKGYGGCIFGSIRRAQLSRTLNIPERFEILYVLALGRPIEQISIEDVGADGDIRYYRDNNQRHHVPKRTLEDLIVNFE